MQGPRNIAARVVKVNFAKAGPDQNPPSGLIDLRFIPYPGMNGGSFFGLLRYVIPAEPKAATGFHIVRPGTADSSFYFFNLIDEAKLQRHKGEVATVVFTCNVPRDDAAPVLRREMDGPNVPTVFDTGSSVFVPTWPSWQVNFVRGEEGPVTVGLFSKRSGNWLFDLDPRWKFNPPPLPGYEQAPLYVFAGGAPKSGTTWIEKIFNMHGAVMCNGEGGFFLRETQLKFADYNFWLPGNLTEDDYGLMSQAGMVDMIFRAIHSLWPHQVYVDRAPANGYSYAKALAAFP